MILSITFASGATFLSPAPGWQAGNFLAPPGITNGAAVTGNTLYLRNVGLHLDPLATGMPPAWTMPDEAQELAACMRYYYVTGAPQTNVYHYGPASGFMDAGSIPFVVTMRTNPASAITTAPSMTNCSAPIASAISNGATLYVTVATLGGYLANGGIYSFNARM
jgi:hypothetical protein